MREDGGRRRALLVALGCDKNLVDSEHMVALLERAGYAVRVLGAEAAGELPGAAAGCGAGGRPPWADSVEADLAVVNTCAFIGPARAESLGVIRVLARLKGEGRVGRLVVAGCLAQRDAADLLRRVPQADAVVGTGDFHRLEEIVAAVERGERVRATAGPAYRYDLPLPRARLTPPYTAFVKIAEGCDHACSFCVIPSLRGPYRSRPPEAVVAEVEALAAAGVREVNLVAQDCSAYGQDLAGRPLLPGLLARLDRVPGLRWVRLLYNYPTTFTRELAAAMAGLEKVCRYVDLPFQHGSDRILAAMGRGGRRADLLRRLEQIRAALPDAVFRSSFIVGFPGETEADFGALLSFLREAELDYVGFFAYSREEGTPAAALPRQVPEERTERRLARAMALQERISLRRNQARVGRVLEVLVEGEEPGQPGFYRGRWRGQAPEVDGRVIVAAGEALAPGTLVSVRVTWAEEYDLRGVLLTGGPAPGSDDAAGSGAQKEKRPDVARRFAEKLPPGRPVTA